MELTKYYRKEFITKLESINDVIDRIKRDLQEHNLSEESKAWLNIDLFLAQRQTELIKKALIDNEINF